jgi:two-component system, OmpR family, sensor histidine kinase MprB
MSLGRRLTLSSAAAVAIAIIAAAPIIFFVVRDRLRDEIDTGLRELAAEARVTSIPLPPPREGVPVPALRPPEDGDGARRARRHVTLVLPDPALGAPPGYGQLVTDRGDVMLAPRQSQPLPVGSDTFAVAAGEHDAFFEDIEATGTHLRVLTAPVGDGQAIQVARSLEEVDDTLRDLTVVLVLVSLGGIGLAALLGRIVSRTAIAPVRRLTEATEHVARTHDLARRIDPEGRDDELGRLATSFNGMLAALERSISAQRQLVADASHELRTPLTSLRTNIEVLARPNGLPDADRERLLEDVMAQLGELGMLVGNLVDLARGEEPAAPREEVRLDALAADAVDRARRRARERRFVLRAEPCTVEGAPDQLARALDNLLDNAAKWGPAGEEIEVLVSAEGEIAIRDRGPGVEAADRPHVFDRFYRATSARGMPGSGLGLAIVRQVATAHGGTVTVDEAPGGGTLVRMRLPAAELSANSSVALS